MPRRYLTDSPKAYPWFHVVQPNKPIRRHGQRHAHAHAHVITTWTTDELALLEQAFSWTIKTSPDSLLAYVREHPSHQRRPSTLGIAGPLTQQIIRYQTQMSAAFTEFLAVLATGMPKRQTTGSKAAPSVDVDAAIELALSNMEEIRAKDEAAAQSLQYQITTLTVAFNQAGSQLSDRDYAHAYTMFREKIEALAEKAYKDALHTGIEYGKRFFPDTALTPKETDALLKSRIDLNAAYMRTSLLPDILTSATAVAGIEESTASTVMSLGEQFASRFAAYAMPLWGIGSFGFGAAMTANGQQIWWIVTSTAPCADCPDLEDDSPYDDEDNPLPTYPGWGDTECRSNCLCLLVTSPAITLPNGGTAPWAPGRSLQPVKCAWGATHLSGNDCVDIHTGEFCSGKYNENHDELGRFSEGDGERLDVAADPLSRNRGHAAWQELHDRLSKPDGGFSYHVLTGAEPTEGYPVAIYPERSFQAHSTTLNEQDFVDFVKLNRDILTKPDHFFGGWRDPESGIIWLDVSVVKQTEAEAKSLAIKHGQISYFDLKKGTSVNVEGKGTEKGRTGTGRSYFPAVLARAVRAAEREEDDKSWDRQTESRTRTRRKVVSAYRLLTALGTKYREDQARDHGRFADEGGDSGEGLGLPPMPPVPFIDTDPNVDPADNDAVRALQDYHDQLLNGSPETKSIGQAAHSLAWGWTGSSVDKYSLLLQAEVEKQTGQPIVYLPPGFDNTDLRQTLIQDALDDAKDRGLNVAGGEKVLYEMTQKTLADAGVKELTVYRGMLIPPPMPESGVHPVKMNTLSSWSTSERVARDFGISGVVLKMTVKASDIEATTPVMAGVTHISTLLHEHEIVVRAQPDHKAEFVKNNKLTSEPLGWTTKAMASVVPINIEGPVNTNWLRMLRSRRGVLPQPSPLKSIKYNENHDELGRFSEGDGGGGGGGGADRVSERGLSNELRDLADRTNDTGTEVSTVKEAIALLTQNQRVILDKPEMVSTLLEKLAKIAKKARESGEDFDVNLCNVSVSGTNIFCADNVGMTRIQMPQLSTKDPKPGSYADKQDRDEDGRVDLTEDFKVYLKGRGFEVDKVKVQSSHLKASQNELSGAKVAKMMKKLEKGKELRGGIFVSKDNYVIDGHHRWAAQLGADLRRNDDLDKPIKVNRVNASVMETLLLAHKFAKAKGIPSASMAKMTMAGWWARMKAMVGLKYSEDQERDDRGRWTNSGSDPVLPGMSDVAYRPPSPEPDMTQYRMILGELQVQINDQGSQPNATWVRAPVQPDETRINPGDPNLDERSNGYGKPQEMDTNGRWVNLETRAKPNDSDTIEVRNRQSGDWEYHGEVGEQQMQGSDNMELGKDGTWSRADEQPGDQRFNSGHREQMNSNGEWEQQTFTATHPSGSEDGSGGGSGDNRGTGQGGFDYHAPESAPASPGAGRLEDHPEQAGLREKAIKDFELRGTRDDHVNPAYRVTFEDDKQAMWKPGPYYQIDRYDLPDADNIHEQAASDLSHMMEYDDIVPHAVIRTINGVEGSLQEWRDGKHGSHDLSPLDAKRSLAFDYMQANFDRHPRNVLTTPSGKPVLIDNGLSMPATNDDLGLRSNFGVDTSSKIPASVAKSAQHVLDSWEKSAKQLQRGGLSDSALNAMHERITEIATHKGSWDDLPHMQWG